MSIHSSAFGRVTLTDDDAKKFEQQVRYGRPKDAARDSVKRGVEAVKEYRETGALRFSLSVKAK
jgi:hypothetical protein